MFVAFSFCSLQPASRVRKFSFVNVRRRRHRIRHSRKGGRMAGSQAGKRPAQQASHGNWWSDAGNAIDQTRRSLEAKGRAAYEAALREGRPVLARTEAELRELGANVAEAE